jgi:hypothetical protein
MNKTKQNKAICAGCGEEIEPGELAYELRSGYIDDDGGFVRTDCISQVFHIGESLNSKE